MKLSYFLPLILVTQLIFTGCSASRTPEPSAEPVFPQPQDKLVTGAVWFEEAAMTAATGGNLTTNVFVNSGTQRLAAYTFTVTYDPELVALDTSFGIENKGIDKGKDGFVTVINSNNPGKIIISSFDVYGKEPSANLHLLTFKWVVRKAGSAVINCQVTNLNDHNTTVIGNPRGYATKVEITG